MSKTGQKIIEGLKEAVSYAPSDRRINDLMNAIAEVAKADGATWYKIEVKIWHGERRRGLTREGGPQSW